MPTPRFIRALTAGERDALAAGRRSAEAWTVRGWQLLLARAEGQPSTTLARHRRGHAQTVRQAIHAFQPRGLSALHPTASRPQRPKAGFDPQRRARLRTLGHHSPRRSGRSTRGWTLAWAAAVRSAQGLTPRQGSGAARRLARKRGGGRWQRATPGSTSPAPASLSKHTGATACSGGPLRLRRGRAAGPRKAGGAAWRHPRRIVGLRLRRSPGARHCRGPRGPPMRTPWPVLGGWSAGGGRRPRSCGSGWGRGAPSAP